RRSTRATTSLAASRIIGLGICPSDLAQVTRTINASTNVCPTAMATLACKVGPNVIVAAPMEYTEKHRATTIAPLVRLILVHGGIACTSLRESMWYANPRLRCPSWPRDS
ncbi:hypothetical protein ACHAWF_009475, partial [Thalassiosira exigua]